MGIIGLTDTQKHLWWGAVIAGFVVVLAVAALLTILVILVRTIERRVDMIKATLQAAETNTADAELIARTALSVDGVLAEGLEHHLFLGRVFDKVRA
jgi:Tfp pilus assembly major pilin PilA